MKLAVILPAYCAEAYLPECLDSVLNQTFRDFFVIAIDDASTDKTGEILEVYAAKDSRLQVFHLQENSGEPFACQFAMNMLKDVEVEYVARMDADDICALDRFEKQIQFLDSHPEIDIVGSQATIFFDDQTGREPVLSDLPLLDKDIKAFLSFAAQNMFSPTTMWRHDSIKNLGINYTATETAPNFHMWVNVPYMEKPLPTCLSLCCLTGYTQLKKAKKRQNQQIRPIHHGIVVQPPFP